MKKLLKLNNFLEKSGFKSEVNTLKNMISLNPKVASNPDLRLELLNLEAREYRLENSKVILNDMLALNDDEMIEKYKEKMKFTRIKNPVIFRERMIEIHKDRIPKLEAEIADSKKIIEALKEDKNDT